MKVFLCILNVVMAAVAVGAELPTCDLYRVETRVAGGGWCAAEVRPALVAKPKGYLTEPAPVAFASVETAFPVEVRVTPQTPFAAAEIRPRTRGLVGAKVGEAFVFAVTRPENLVVDFDGVIFGNLCLFLDRPLKSETMTCTSSDETRLAFGPGLHRLPKEGLFLRSGQRVFVDAGAWLDGSLVVSNVTDVTIEGHGVVRPLEAYRNFGIRIANSQRVTVRGVVVNQCPVGGSEDITIENVKAVTPSPEVWTVTPKDDAALNSTRWGGLSVVSCGLGVMS